MSKRCRSCGASNEDSRIFCSACGEPLDAGLRLMRDLTEQTSGERKKTYKEPPARHDPTSRAFRSTFDDDELPPKLSRKKDSSAALWILLAVAAAAVVIAVYVW